MHNVVQSHNHAYILLDDKDPKQGFFLGHIIQLEFVVEKPHATLAAAATFQNPILKETCYYCWSFWSCYVAYAVQSM